MWPFNKVNPGSPSSLNRQTSTSDPPRADAQVTPSPQPSTSASGPTGTPEPSRRDAFQGQTKSQVALQSPPPKPDTQGREELKAFYQSRKGLFSFPKPEEGKPPPKMEDGKRLNHYFRKEDDPDNLNIHSVIYQSKVPQSSAGWDAKAHNELFTKLGSSSHPVGSLPRNAEQEYLLSNMPKGAMLEASNIATQHQMGIAVRGTGYIAHMGIESGNPTKAQEFKNKTSKETDLWLCDGMSFGDVGAVVHYDPRVKGSSAQGAPPPDRNVDKKGWTNYVETAWKDKREHIEQHRMPALQSLGTRVSAPRDEKAWKGLQEQFESRLAEFIDNDKSYRPGGSYAEHVVLEGPFIHLKERPGEHMYGDHDLFAFAPGNSHQPVRDTNDQMFEVQKALQDANTFQAQHGGIWNWQPTEPSHQAIKAKIMKDHSPPDGQPLVFIQPGGVVTAAFYVPGEVDQTTGQKAQDQFVPVWDRPDATKWLGSTHSGRQVLVHMKAQEMAEKNAQRSAPKGRDDASY